MHRIENTFGLYWRVEAVVKVGAELWVVRAGCWVCRLGLVWYGMVWYCMEWYGMVR